MSNATRTPGQEAVGQLCFGGLTVVQIFDRLSAVTSERDALAKQVADLRDFAQAVARSACLQQRVGDKCICFACEARAALERSV